MLYEQERLYKEKKLTYEQIQEQRQAHAKSSLEKMLYQLKEVKVPEQSLLYKAIRYFINHYEGLCCYTADGRLEIDNNRSERAIKTFVIGRKNWLFSDTVKGAESSMVLYSVLETAKANGLEPWKYLTKLFTELPLCRAEEEIEQLLPFAT